MAQTRRTIQGVGATFPAKLYTALSGLYSAYDPNWSYAYTGSTSGIGRTSLAAGASGLTWAGSDNILSNTTYVGPGNTAGQFIPVPSVIRQVSGIAIVYHLNITNLTLTRQNVADIFTGKIAFWNDSRLAQNNPALLTISAPIQTIVRSGHSGTTSNFQYALNSFDRTLRLPSPQMYPIASWGIANPPFYAASNTILSDAIQVAPYTIGYVDYADGYNTLASLAPGQSLYSIASIINRNGDTVAPSIASLNVAISTPSTANISAVSHFTNNISSILQATYIDSATPGAYPLMAPTYMFLRQDSQLYNITELQMRATLRFLFWMVFGGTEANNFVHFGDARIRQFAFDALKLVTHNGKALYDPASPCNPYFDANGTYISANSCKNGYCIVDGPFQDSSVIQCVCDVGYYNNQRLDCSEPASPFAVLVTGDYSGNAAVVALFTVTLVINFGIFALLVLWRNKANIKAISPNCCYIIMVGSIIGQLGALFYSAQPSSVVCSSRVFFPVVAFSSVFSMLLMKSLRIYMIFGNKRMRVFKTPDWKLILGTAIIVAIEIIICIAWMAVENPMAQIVGTSYSLVCSATSGPTVVPEILLYVMNGLVMIGCVAVAFLTRGAHKRFQESKVIGICVYMVFVTLLLCLPILYILSGSVNSDALFTVGRVMLGCVIVVISSLVPIILFGVRLVQTFHNERSEVDKPSQNSAPTDNNRSAISSQGMVAANVLAYAYDCGLQGLKFGGAWVSSNVLVFTTLDLIEFREADADGTIQASFRFSSCECEPCQLAENSDSEKALARSVRLRRNKMVYTLEFGSKETAQMFLENYAEVKSRSGAHSVLKAKTTAAGLQRPGSSKRDNTVFAMLDKLAVSTNNNQSMASFTKSAPNQSQFDAPSGALQNESGNPQP
ncbi:uncharacterized protein BJ171DRAFT_601826 [Polychytrium aggregatum]|uniref:uncharacterized protein n=1 Tax=Polychytrium aggregatum TaxID=110093 RepID=UPI0022FDF14E|nr:uncharacterized protein BJ171DRAFT_601826 [Polychytrium aggregatum]KAI9199459.1 hypothetical protein BJ171DRAFT_601826 [Polychytrium aggregatum]